MKFFLKFVVVTVTALTVVACAGSKPTTLRAPFPPETTPRQLLKQAQVGLYEVTCWFKRTSAQPPLNCYQMVVPQNYDHPKAGSVSFPVVYFKASTQQGPPILHLGGGGPGAGMDLQEDEFVNYMIWQYGGISLDLGRDLLVIDPRGAGVSSPRLICQPCRDMIIEERSIASSVDSIADKFQQCYQTCQTQSLQQGIDLGQYHTLNVTRDLMSLREALNIDSWSIYGISYGGYYALSLAHQDGDAVESMLLDSPAFPLQQESNHYPILDLLKAFERAIQYCENQRHCHQLYPNYRQHYEQLLTAIDQQPLQLTINKDQDATRVLLDVDLFLWYISQMLYAQEGYDQMPLLVNALNNPEIPENKDHIDSFFNEFFEVEEWGFKTMSYLSLNAHYCFEEQPHYNHQKSLEFIKKMKAHEAIKRWATQIIDEDNDFCPSLHQNRSQLADLNFLPTDIPTLLLHGKNDPVIPFDLVEQFHQQYLDSNIFVFTEAAHAILNFEPCGLIAMQMFLSGKDLSTDLPEWCMARTHQSFFQRPIPEFDKP